MPADEEGPEEHLEYRNCGCLSTQIMPVAPTHAGTCALRRERDPEGALMPRRRSTYDVRSEDLDRLFYATTKDEMGLESTRENDRLARAILADALEERGMFDLARRLRQFPPNERFFHSLLREKVRRAIFGPQKRQSFTARKPIRDVLLAYIPAPESYFPRPPAMWMDIGHVSQSGTGSRSYLFHTTYDGRYLVRDAQNEGDALDVAMNNWPDIFVGDDDNPSDDFAVYRVGDVRRARLLDDIPARGQRAYVRERAHVPNYGVVEFR